MKCKLYGCDKQTMNRCEMCDECHICQTHIDTTCKCPRCRLDRLEFQLSGMGVEIE